MKGLGAKDPSKKCFYAMIQNRANKDLDAAYLRVAQDAAGALAP